MLPLEEVIPCPDRDLVTGEAIQYTHHLAPWVPLEATEAQVPTKTSNSPSSTSRETEATGSGTFLQTKTGPVPPSARGWPCLRTEAVIKGSLVDPRCPHEWIGPEAKDHEPCPPRETENDLCLLRPSRLEKARHRRRTSRQPRHLPLAPARANPAIRCPAVRSS